MPFKGVKSKSIKEFQGTISNNDKFEVPFFLSEMEQGVKAPCDLLNELIGSTSRQYLLKR